MAKFNRKYRRNEQKIGHSFARRAAIPGRIRLRFEAPARRNPRPSRAPACGASPSNLGGHIPLAPVAGHRWRCVIYSIDRRRIRQEPTPAVSASLKRKADFVRNRGSG
jgi:hypothetical protein